MAPVRGPPVEEPPGYGADVNAANNKRNTATHFAVQYGFDALADFLVERGANRDARNDDGHKFRPEFLEGNSQVEKRAATLLDLLRGRKEYSIAVVAHKGYLRELYKGTLARLKVGRCSGAPALHRAITEALPYVWCSRPNGRSHIKRRDSPGSCVCGWIWSRSDFAIEMAEPDLLRLCVGRRSCYGPAPESSSAASSTSARARSPSSSSSSGGSDSEE